MTSNLTVIDVGSGGSNVFFKLEEEAGGGRKKA
jgi:hypothetical protein